MLAMEQYSDIYRGQKFSPNTKIFGKKLGDYLKEFGIKTKEELENAEKKLKTLENHLKKNHTDKKAKHKLQKFTSHLNILKKYYKKE